MYDHNMMCRVRNKATTEVVSAHKEEDKAILLSLKATSPSNYTNLARTVIKNNHIAEWRAHYERLSTDIGHITSKRRAERALERANLRAEKARERVESLS